MSRQRSRGSLRPGENDRSLTISDTKTRPLNRRRQTEFQLIQTKTVRRRSEGATIEWLASSGRGEYSQLTLYRGRH